MPSAEKGIDDIINGLSIFSPSVPVPPPPPPGPCQIKSISSSPGKDNKFVGATANQASGVPDASALGTDSVSVPFTS